VIKGLVLNSRDIMARKQAEEALREMNDMLEQRVDERTNELSDALERLEKAHIAQKRFVADASHDIRTPLTVMRAELDLLLATNESDAAINSSLERLLSEVMLLEHLSSDLLLLAKLDSFAPKDHYRAVRIDAVVIEAINQLSALANERKIRWNVQIDDPGPFHGDRRALERATRNVLHNAILYSHEGGEVEVSVRREDECVVIRVKDHGVGIRRENLDRVFDRFYRGDLTRTTPGTGLGLAIVRAVVDAHGGEATIESAEGVGTTVTMSLECPEPDENDVAPDAMPMGND
jgi:two-component system OmpR family sensor kinase